MPNLMQSINPNSNLTSPGSEEEGDDGGRRRRRRRLQDGDGEGEMGEGMEGAASDSQLIVEENGLTEEAQVGYGPPESWMWQCITITEYISL